MSEPWPLTVFPADCNDGTEELQACVPTGSECTGRTLHPAACPEVDGVQGDHLGAGEEGVGVYFLQGAGDAITATRGADKPAVLGQGVVDILS